MLVRPPLLTASGIKLLDFGLKERDPSRGGPNFLPRSDSFINAVSKARKTPLRTRRAEAVACCKRPMRKAKEIFQVR